MITTCGDDTKDKATWYWDAGGKWTVFTLDYVNTCKIDTNIIAMAVYNKGASNSNIWAIPTRSDPKEVVISLMCTMIKKMAKIPGYVTYRTLHSLSCRHVLIRMIMSGIIKFNMNMCDAFYQCRSY